MSVTKITVDDINSIITTAYNQAVNVGEDTISDVTAIDFTTFNDVGSTEDILKLREKFTGALIVQISKTYYKNRMEGAVLDDIFFEDADSFGAITQIISARMPSAKSNSAMQTFVSGSTQVGVYTVYLPIVENELFVKQDSWAMPLTITGEQWNSAFKDLAGLNTFVNYILMVYHENSRLHSEMMSRLNRNSFIARKINEQNGVVNLIEEYYNDGRYEVAEGQTKITWNDVKHDKDFLLWTTFKIAYIKNRLLEYNNAFSTDEYPQTCPSDRLICEFLDSYALRVKEAETHVYHNDLIALPNYREISHWQEGGTEAVNMNISAELGEDENEQTISVSGNKIIGLMVDKWAIMHTNILHRTPCEHFAIEDVTHYENQFVDKFINNLKMKGVVLTVDDFTIPTP